MRDLFINHPEEVKAQQPAGRALRLRAFRLSQGDTLNDVYETAGAGISFIDDVVNPEFQRLMALYRQPKLGRKRRKLLPAAA